MKLYTLVKDLLTENPVLRDSDKRLQWEVYEELYLTFQDILRKEQFIDGPSFESVRRCRQMIQAKYPELRGTRKIQEARAEKAKEKGTFVFREQTRLV